MRLWYRSVPRQEDEVAKKTKTPIDDQPPRRRAILAAAYDVLMERGYAGASTLEIATRAKVSKRELYAEFGNKAGILEALIASTSARMQAPLKLPEVADTAALADVLTRYGITALRELCHPAVVAINRLAAAEAGGASELGHILDRGGREPNRLALGAFIARAQKAGLLGDGAPDRMSGQFFSLLFGDIPVRLMLGTIAPPAAKEIKERAEAATEALLRLHPHA
jgi:AcrR family transcriptional regulator